MTCKYSALLLASSVLASTPALAQAPAQPQQQQPPPPTTPPAPDGRDAVHGEPGTIVVTRYLLRDLDLLAGKSVLDEDALQREVRPQIGDTLAKLPGVS
ncbi:MAG: TonB-dependent receptor, partial [Pseudomonadota bacterium]|nr:TonB-dependent receptor [Pseudomonadota bacterium]